MITNNYSSDLIIPEGFVLPRRSYHRFYVKQVKRSRIKHVLFALFVVAVLIGASLFLKSLS